MDQNPGMHTCTGCGLTRPSTTPFCPKCGRATNGSNAPQPAPKLVITPLVPWTQNPALVACVVIAVISLLCSGLSYNSTWLDGLGVTLAIAAGAVFGIIYRRDYPASAQADMVASVKWVQRWIWVWGSVVIGLIVVIAYFNVFAVMNLFQQGKHMEGFTAKDNVSCGTYTIETDQICSYCVGTVTNETNATLTLMQVDFILIDAQGTQIGTASDVGYNIAPKMRWKYKAMLTTSEGVAKISGPVAKGY